MFLSVWVFWNLDGLTTVLHPACCLVEHDDCALELSGNKEWCV